MSYAQFVRFAMQKHIAPPSAGPNVKTRKYLVQQALKWKPSRIDDAWIANPKMRFKPEEIDQIEKVTGLAYKDFLKLEHEALSEEDNLLDAATPDLQRAVYIGISAFLSALGDAKHMEQFSQLQNMGDR